MSSEVASYGLMSLGENRLRGAFCRSSSCHFVSSFLISSGRSILLVHRVQCLYGSSLGSFARWNKSCNGASDNYEQRGLHADTEAHGGIDEHFLLKCACVHGGVAYSSIHPKIRTNAKHHTNIAEEEGDNNALGDDEL